MKKANRTKKELEESLAAIAKDIFSREEFPVIPKNAELKDKLDAHTSKWRTPFNEFVADAFLFAQQIHYSADFFRQNNISDKKDDPVSKAERLVFLYYEDLMKLSYRIFAKKSGKPDNDFSAYFKTDNDFIVYFETSIRKEFKRAMVRNKTIIDRKQGITGTGLEKKKRISSDYNKFKTNIKGFKKNHKELTEEKIQQLYISTSNRYGITIEKLREAILVEQNASVLLESRTIDEGDGTSTVFDSLAGTDTVETNLIDEAKIDEIAQTLLAIDEEYSCAQERTKPYLSALLMWVALNYLKTCVRIDNEHINNLLKKRAFAQTEKAQNILKRFLSNDELPTQKEVAAMFRRDKTDASRTIKKFKEKLKKHSNVRNNFLEIQ